MSSFANVNYFELLPIHVVGVGSSGLTFDDVPGFYVLASYFDYNDVTNEAALNADYDELISYGISGVRLMPNWYNQHRQSDGLRAYAGDTLIQPDGSIDETAYNHLIWHLDRARAKHLWVDLSLSAETVALCAETEDCQAPPPDSHKAQASLIFENFKGQAIEKENGTWEGRGGILELVYRLVERERRLAARVHGNVVIDIQNESNGVGPLWQPLTEAQISTIISEIELIDASRLVMASVANEMSGADAGGRAERTGQDIVAYHDPRGQNWWELTDEHIAGIRSETSKIIYFQEPERYREQTWLTADEFLKAPCRAKRYGASAWTFHNSASFHMNQSGLFGPQDQWNEKLKQVERDFLEGLAAKLQEPACQPQ